MIKAYNPGVKIVQVNTFRHKAWKGRANCSSFFFATRPPSGMTKLDPLDSGRHATAALCIKCLWFRNAQNLLVPIALQERSRSKDG